MHPISSQDESWFPDFDWSSEPHFHKHLKMSLPSAIGMRNGTCFFCIKWNESEEGLTEKKAEFPCSGLNSHTSFISQDEGMSESPVEILEKEVGLHFIWTGASHPFDTSRGTRNSVLQKVTMPDYSWKWLGIPISLCQLESEPRSPGSPPQASILSCQA